MSEGKNTLFTIGQFAALHGINKKTLMWYDEIGLFQPAVISEENGYRYYNYYQSSVLETILMLRDMKVPLADIKSFIKKPVCGEYGDITERKDKGIKHGNRQHESGTGQAVQPARRHGRAAGTGFVRDFHHRERAEISCHSADLGEYPFGNAD